MLNKEDVHISVLTADANNLTGKYIKKNVPTFQGANLVLAVLTKVSDRHILLTQIMKDNRDHLGRTNTAIFR